MIRDRRQAAYEMRVEAAGLARARPQPPHRANGDEERFAAVNYAMSFTKGLPHDYDTGLICDRRDFEAFRKAIDEGYIDAFSRSVPVATTCPPAERRRWEAPTAGVVFDLEGPDAQAVTMPPAPPLGSAELAYEMAEVYELALLHDVPFSAFRDGVGNPDVTVAIDRLNALDYKPAAGTGRPRITVDGLVTEQTVFRGSSPGVDVGPYVSQFMLIGTPSQSGDSGVADGRITYGALQIDQRVPAAAEVDWMTDFDSWFRVQQGCVVPDAGLFASPPSRRFLSRPRDLATYVHYDALYEAYLNAALILLEMNTPFDPGFANLAGQEDRARQIDYGAILAVQPDGGHLPIARQAGGFALYGGPHILTLVTEVATRALKAVRYQKFNVHLRLRPEALAARIACADAIEHRFPGIGAPFTGLRGAISDTVAAVQARTGNALLPMAFPEGSPMHPSYGAGHATVAGACVTVLKAFFDTSAVFVRRDGGEAFLHRRPGDVPIAYTPDAAATALIQDPSCPVLTLEGELNKLAANISIGRNMAGVHYFSDYYDSLRMGEEIAIGVLEEQALCYPTDPFVMSVPTFDGPVRRIGAR